ncbi:hypothetical protein [Serinicoccus sp. CNJ-927]|uniref:hypothetical protein n=1 Tax=Serinicoccus sp. CNJ-927 TaxID=1904970 RepID=UPI001300D057|nr:hypothetical protein [Serinicoccus sp. CNJ-927]
MSEELTAWLSAIAAVIAALVGLWGLMTAVARPARLRREEAQWRELLEAGTCPPGQHRLVEDLHRYVGAQLVGQRLRPASDPFLRPVGFLFGTVFAVLLGVLAAAIGVEVLRGAVERVGVGAWLFLLGLAVGTPMVLGGLLVPLAEEANARHAIARDLLADEVPITVRADSGMLARFRHHHQSTRRHLRTGVVGLALGATVIPAGLAAAFTAAWLADNGLAQPVAVGAVAVGGLLVYAWAWAWCAPPGGPWSSRHLACSLPPIGRSRTTRSPHLSSRRRSQASPCEVDCWIWWPSPSSLATVADHELARTTGSRPLP